MNTYSKFCPHVFLAKCEEQHEEGSEIVLTTRYGKENLSIVHNLIYEKDGFFFYSITRSDGFDTKEWAQRKANRYADRALSAKSKSNEHRQKANKDMDFLRLGEPIKVGHHSEKRHRKIIQQAQDQMFKFVEFYQKAEELESRIGYWAKRANEINLSMPDSLEYYEIKLHQATEYHKAMKKGDIPRSHSFSLTYAKKDVNEAKKKYDIAQKLWA